MSYIVTRPLGASFADYISKPKHLSGLNFGDGPTAIVFAVAVFVLVSYLAVARPDIQKPRDVATARDTLDACAARSHRGRARAGGRLAKPSAAGSGRNSQDVANGLADELGELVDRHVAEQALAARPARRRPRRASRPSAPAGRAGSRGSARTRRNRCSMSSFSARWRSLSVSCSSALWLRWCSRNSSRFSTTWSMKWSTSAGQASARCCPSSRRSSCSSASRPSACRRRCSSKQDVLLALEVVVERRLRRAEPLGDVAQRGLVVALIDEQLERDVEDPLTRRRLRLARPQRRPARLASPGASADPACSVRACRKSTRIALT